MGVRYLRPALKPLFIVVCLCIGQDGAAESDGTARIIEGELERIGGRVESLGGWKAWDDSLAAWREAIGALPVVGKGRSGIEATLFHGGTIGFLGRGLGLRDAADVPAEPWEASAVAAARELSSQLAARGIDLIVVPVPCKLSIYPERSGSTPPAEVGVQYLRLVSGLLSNQVQVLDLYSPFLERRFDRGEMLFYRTDDHWNGRGIVLSASLIAERLSQYDAIAEAKGRPPVYERKSVTVKSWRGKLAEGTDQWKFPPEDNERFQIFNADGTLYAEPLTAPVVVLGDSFALYQRFNGTATDVGPNLAYELNCPVQTLVNYGILAQQVPRLVARQGQDFLNNRVIVVWVMMDISFQDHL